MDRLLCICQDSRSDWHAQSARMQYIYSGAICNIAATSGKDSTVGLRFSRNPIANIPFQITVPRRPRSCGDETGNLDTKYVSQNASALAADIREGPLNRRAWVYQDRFISRRIMHFTSSGVYWECMTDICSDIHPSGVPQSLPDFPDRPVKLKQMAFSHISNQPHSPNACWTDELYLAWADLLVQYTNLRLSYTGDVFVALDGIAREVANMTGDTLICGLWEQHMLSQLLWHKYCDTTGSLLPDDWRAPSWSWASKLAPTGSVTHILCECSQSRARVESINVGAKASGQVKSASITLCGRVVRANLEVPGSGESWNSFSMVCATSGDTRHKLRFAKLDDRDIETVLGDVMCITLYEDTCEKGLLSPWSIFGSETFVLGILILQACDSEPDLCRRVDVMFLGTEHLDFYNSNESLDQHQITIV